MKLLECMLGQILIKDLKFFYHDISCRNQICAVFLPVFETSAAFLTMRSLISAAALNRSFTVSSN